jgi:hypothetical protein
MRAGLLPLALASELAALMPGTPHEVLIATLREQPALLGTLVHALTGRTLPPGLAPVDSTVRFVKGAEVRPDLLLAHGPRWTLVEVQNAPDPDKQRRWLLAAGVLFDQSRVLGDVIVITASRTVARWARTVAHVATPLGTRLELTPVVLYVSAQTCERLLSEAHPELALIAIWAVSHRHGPAARRVVERAIEVTRKLPAELQQAQRNAILMSLSERMITWLKETTMYLDNIPMSAAARRFKAEMLIEGKREALLLFLRGRGLAVTAEERATIEDCGEPATLDRWIEKAGSAPSVDEVLAPEKKARAKRSPTRAAKRPARTTKRAATRG